MKKHILHILLIKYYVLKSYNKILLYYKYNIIKLYINDWQLHRVFSIVMLEDP